MKQISNYIIPPDDPRYGKLGHLWKKYKYEIFKGSDSLDHIITKPFPKSYWFKIPCELIINYDSRFKVQHCSNNYNFVCINVYYMMKAVPLMCGFSCQDYYDLMKRHINTRQNIIKCPVCHNTIPFLGALRGYASAGRMDFELIGLRTCSRKCQNIYKYWRPDLYGECGTQKARINQLTHTTWFKNKYGNKTCYFYIATIGNKFKFGITSFPDARKHCLETWEQKNLTNFKVILSNSGNYVADLEYCIKNKLGRNSEYLDFIGFVSEFRKAFIESKLIIDSEYNK